MTLDEFLHYTSIVLMFSGLILMVISIAELFQDGRKFDNDMRKIKAFELIGSALVTIATLIGGILLYWVTK